IGQIATAPGTQVQQFSNFILVDNGRGGTLRFGSGEGGYNHIGAQFLGGSTSLILLPSSGDSGSGGSGSGGSGSGGAGGSSGSSSGSNMSTNTGLVIGVVIGSVVLVSTF
ncbi:unnamed protein product, partial [Sphagnum balticum]